MSGYAIVLDTNGLLWRYKITDKNIGADREAVAWENFESEGDTVIFENDSSSSSLFLKDDRLFERRNISGAVHEQEIFLKTPNVQAVAWAQKGNLAVILLSNETVEWINLSEEEQIQETPENKNRISGGNTSIAFHDVTAANWAMQPTLQVVGGNDQTGIAGEYTRLTLDVGVTDGLSTLPLADVPVTFSVVSGGGFLAKEKKSELSTSLTVLSDEDGIVSALYKLSPERGVIGKVNASSGNASVQFRIYEESALVPPMLMSISPNPGGISDGDKEPPKEHLRLWLSSFNNPRIEALNGKIYFWGNKAGENFNGIQNTINNQPSGSMDGTTLTVRFDGDSYNYMTLGNVMSGATEGEVFVLLRVRESSPGKNRGLWSFNGGYSAYPNTTRGIAENFGSTTLYPMPAPSLNIEDWHIYNVSAKTNFWTARFNGKLHYQSSNNTVAFSSVYLGLSQQGYFDGDILEILVYDKMLTNEQREDVGFYLESLYNLSSIDRPAAPTDLAAVPVSKDQVSLKWKASEGALYYTVERKSDSDWESVGEFIYGSSFIDSGLVSGKSYTYRVRAINYTKKWSCSDEVTVNMQSLAPSIPVGNIQLWLKGENVQTGKIAFWTDVSGKDHHGSQVTVDYRPQSALSPCGDYSVVRFDGNKYESLRFGNVLKDATEGEVFVVLKAKEAKPAKERGLWTFGPSTSRYPSVGGSVQEYFGSDTLVNMGDSMDVAQWHIYNVSAKKGLWRSFFNGNLHYQKLGGTVRFTTDFVLGYGSNCTFDGDIAELLVFDKALSEGERHSVGRYLGHKYSFLSPEIPDAPADLKALAISNEQVSLTWEGVKKNGVRYIIERKGIDNRWKEIATVDGRSYIDRNLFSGESYRYRVKASTYGGDSSYIESNEVILAFSGYPIPLNDVRVWLQADAQVAGPLNCWLDQSGNGNHGVGKAEVIDNGIGTYPSVRFTPSKCNQFILRDAMNGAKEGEVFAVVKAKNKPSASSGALWNFGGTYITSGYPNVGGSITENFGINANLNTGVPSADLSQWHIYNISAKPNVWTSRINGRVHYATSNYSTLSWINYIYLGYAYASYFDGDIAEVIIFDTALSEAERNTVGNYLGAKYNINTIDIPDAPDNVTATAIGHQQIALSWKGNGSNYVIERKTLNGEWEVLNNGVLGHSFIDNEITAGETYFYRIKATNYNGTSAYTEVISVRSLAIDYAAIPLENAVLWLRADVQNTGSLSCWMDQSGKGNNGAQATGPYQPEIITNDFGYPVVRFNGACYLNFGNVMKNAAAGEIFAVLKAKDAKPRQSRVLWSFGGYNAGSYPDTAGNVSENFGSNAIIATGASADISQWHIYNVSCESGSWKNRFNGTLNYQQTNHTVTWNSNVCLGYSLGYYFDGDIAEILVFDKVLSDGERQSVGRYLRGRYSFLPLEVPDVPTDLKALAISNEQIFLTWEGARKSGVSYTVERKGQDNRWKEIAVVEGRSYIDRDLLPGGSYSYRVKAGTYAGDSSYAESGEVVLASSGESIPLNNVRVWLQADAQVTGPLTYWADQSGKGNHGVGKAEVIDNGIGTYPSVRFTPSKYNQFILRDAMNGAKEGEIFTVVKAKSKSPTSARALWNFGGTYITSGYPNVGGSITENFGINANLNTGVPSADLNQWHVYNISAKPNAWTSRINGRTHYTTSNYSTLSWINYIYLGYAYASYFDGDIAEVILFDKTFSEAERRTVESYLSLKYKLHVFEPTEPQTVGNFSIANRNGVPVLSWLAGNNRMGAEYIIERREPGGNWEILATTTSLNYFDTAADRGKMYEYRIITKDDGKESDYSDIIQCLTPLDIPSELNLVLSGQITLSWNTGHNPEDTVYVIERQKDDASWEAIAFVNGAEYADDAIVAGNTYQYRLYAKNDRVESGYSETVSLFFPLDAPVFSDVSVSDAEVRLSLSGGANSENTQYVIERRENGYGWQTIATIDTLVYTDSDVQPDKEYEYRAKAVLDGDVSAYSAGVFVYISGENESKMPVRDNLCLWLRADRGVRTEGGFVSSWVDQSDHGKNIYVSSTSARPQFTPEALNSLPVLDFDGIGNSLDFGSVISGDGEGEAFIVLKSDRVNNPLWQMGGAGGSYYPDAEGYIRDDFGTVAGRQTEADLPLDGWHLYTVASAKNYWANEINGIALKSYFYNKTAFPQQMILGKAGDGFFSGGVAEILLYDKVLDSAEKQAVQAYLVRKYGLLAVPQKPDVFEAIPLSSGSIGLRWTPSVKGVTYNVERKEIADASENWVLIAEINGEDAYSVIDYRLSPQTRYDYRLRIANLAGEGEQSFAFANTLPLGEDGYEAVNPDPGGSMGDWEYLPDPNELPKLEAPKDFRLRAQPGEYDTEPYYTYDWDAVASETEAVRLKSYRIYSTGGILFGEVSRGATTFKLDPAMLVAGVYYVYVAAVDQYGRESLSNRLSLTVLGSSFSSLLPYLQGNYAPESFKINVELKRMINARENKYSADQYAKYFPGRQPYQKPSFSEMSWNSQWNCKPLSGETYLTPTSWLESTAVFDAYQVNGAIQDYTESVFRFSMDNHDKRARVVPVEAITAMVYNADDSKINDCEYYDDASLAIELWREIFELKDGQSKAYGRDSKEMWPTYLTGHPYFFISRLGSRNTRLYLYNPTIYVTNGQSDYSPNEACLALSGGEGINPETNQREGNFFPLNIDIGVSPMEKDADGSLRYPVKDVYLRITSRNARVYAEHIETGLFEEIIFRQAKDEHHDRLVCNNGKGTVFSDHLISEDLRARYFKNEDEAKKYRFYMETVKSDMLSQNISLHVNLGDYCHPSSCAFRIYPSARILVDANRDGNIDDTDITSEDNPFLFWVNSNNDNEIDSSNYFYDEIELDDDEVKIPEDKDWTNNYIDNERDLEDFARLWVNISPEMVDKLAKGEIQLAFRWEETGKTNPAIQLFRATDSNGGTGYLFDSEMAEQQVLDSWTYFADGTKEVLFVGGNGDYVLPEVWIHNSGLNIANPKLCFLFEGCYAGKGKLCVYYMDRNRREIALAGSVWIDLKEPGQLVERFTCGDSSGGDVLPVTPFLGSPLFAPPANDYEKDYVLYVHGYNMSLHEKQRWIERTYKRLYWLGYKGRVGGFSWPCTYGTMDKLFFDRSEERAWLSAVRLKEHLLSLKLRGYRVHVLAHSQGNVVTSEALRLWREQGNADALVASYVASQAAYPASAYNKNRAIPGHPEANLIANHMMNIPDVYHRYWRNGNYDRFPKTWPVDNPSYMDADFVRSAAGCWINFYNREDYALVGNSLLDQPAWELNQRQKADQVLNDNPMFHSYSYMDDEGFRRAFGVMYPKTWENLYFPVDRYKIFSYGAPSWSKALGTMDVGGVFENKNENGVNENAVNLQRLDGINDKSPHNYKEEHIWHSGQFRSYYAVRYKYWVRFLRSCQIPYMEGIE